MLHARQSLQRRHFNSLAAAKCACPKFAEWCAQQYEPPTLLGSTLTPAQSKVERRRVMARQMRALPTRLPIAAGRLHFIRLVYQAGLLSLLNEDWRVGKQLAGQYVWATLVTHERRLKIYPRRFAATPVHLFKTFHYEIPEPIAPIAPIVQALPSAAECTHDVVSLTSTKRIQKVFTTL